MRKANMETLCDSRYSI